MAMQTVPPPPAQEERPELPTHRPTPPGLNARQMLMGAGSGGGNQQAQLLREFQDNPRPLARSISKTNISEDEVKSQVRQAAKWDRMVEGYLDIRDIHWHLNGLMRSREGWSTYRAIDYAKALGAMMMGQQHQMRKGWGGAMQRFKDMQGAEFEAPTQDGGGGF